MAPHVGRALTPWYGAGMRTVVCNFGLENWAWPECLRRGTITVMDDVRVHDFYLAGDREGYIRAAQKHLHAPGNPPVNRAVASRWYGLNSLLFETDGDLWLHKDGDRLWWTTSTGAEPSHEIVDEPKPRFGGKVRAHLYQKPCTGWSDRSRTGASLRWGAIHPKAQDFPATQGTFMTLRPDNALYAQTLVDGGDLSAWHRRPEWIREQGKAKRQAGKIFDARGRTIVRIAMTVTAAVAASGSTSLVTKKAKEFRFPSQVALEAHIAELMEANEMTCALTGLQMQLDDGDDDALRVSLDRIDSDGHYERGNLQLVCKFANRWKGDQVDAEFRRLIGLIRNVELGPADGAEE